MSHVVKSLLVPFTSEQMYNLINDVALYPDFLPWCKKAVIHEQNETTLAASLCIGQGLIKQTLSTVNTMVPGSCINMHYQAGPFKKCTGSWEFVPTNNGLHCQIIFNMQYEFKNKLQALTLQPFFNSLSNGLIDAFYQRAMKLYGR